MDLLKSEIGEFPVSWDIKRIDSAFDIQQGKQISKKNRDGEHQGPFLRTKNVFWNRLELTDLDEIHFSEAEQKRLQLRARQHKDLTLDFWRSSVDRMLSSNDQPPVGRHR